jgi:hypothetical protein
MWELWPVILAGGVVVYTLLRYRETFIIKYGNPFDDEDIVSFDREAKGTRLFSTTPDSCPAHKSDLDAGLCYEPCEVGYHGVGPVCWADTVNIGTGRPVGLEPCPAGWVNDGLTCRQPIRCATGLKFFTEGCSGGRIQGRLNNGGICDWPSDRGNLPDWLVDKRDPKNYIATHPDKVDGLCYKKCPADKPNHVPGMPYLCFKGSRGLSYGRGAGEVPPIVRFGA